MYLDDLQPRLNSALDSLSSIGVGMLQAVVVIVLARLLHRFFSDKLMGRLDAATLSESGRSTVNILSSIAVGVISATVLLALWGVTWSGIVTAVSLGTLGILLGIQDVLKSLIGGVFLVLERPYAIGDRVQFRDVTGRIIAIELRTTILRSDSGHRIVAPNSIVFTDTITNFSLRRQIRTTIVLRGLSPEAFGQRAELEKAMTEIDGVDGLPEIRFLAHGRDVSHLDSIEPTSRLQSRYKGRNLEARISWVGSGEPEVQSVVTERLRGLFPSATVRVNKYGRAVGS